MTLLIAILLLSSPTAWEIWNDRHGDLNKVTDVAVRLTLMGVTALICDVWFSLIASLNLSIAIHFAFFDYIIAYILIKNGTIEPPRGVRIHWFTYVGKSGVVDNFKFWRNMRCGWRFAIRLTYLTVSLLIFLTHGNL